MTAILGRKHGGVQRIQSSQDKRSRMAQSLGEQPAIDRLLLPFEPPIAKIDADHDEGDRELDEHPEMPALNVRRDGSMSIAHAWCRRTFAGRARFPRPGGNTSRRDSKHAE